MARTFTAKNMPVPSCTAFHTNIAVGNSTRDDEHADSCNTGAPGCNATYSGCTKSEAKHHTAMNAPSANNRTATRPSSWWLRMTMRDMVGLSKMLRQSMTVPTFVG